MDSLIARRLKHLRESRKLTQRHLSDLIGFKDRQTLADIEAGKRKVSADELLRAMQVLKVDLAFFTDSFRLAGEGAFSWRAKRAEPETLASFEDRAGRWLATYRNLSPAATVAASALRPRLALTVQSTYEEARAAGDALAREWTLGEVPALELERALEQRLDTLVLYVDAPGAISGAACRVADLNAILVNRHEPAGRRSYDIAHEAFHLLTWEQMPPEHSESVEPPRGGKAKRVEQLADNFASALLMPSAALEPRWRARGGVELHHWMNETATHFRVTALALKWRLVQLAWLDKGDQLGINDRKLVANGQPQGKPVAPPLFSRRFVERVHRAVDTGELSVRRTASLLGLTIEDLAELFRDAYGLSAPFGG
jgi:Zn-dependent peptidase ImmA (M78 family)/DNA-binding XRE family transcriptional regulator